MEAVGRQGQEQVRPQLPSADVHLSIFSSSKYKPSSSFLVSKVNGKLASLLGTAVMERLVSLEILFLLDYYTCSIIALGISDFSKRSLCRSLLDLVS